MRREHNYFVYFLASQRNGTLYTGVTNDLGRRCREHRTGDAEGFTKKYGVKLLVYFELFGDVGEAILREKTLKRWRRIWKLELIEKANPTWKDLYDDVTGGVEQLPGTKF